ncbi:MAG: hypothetical protein Q8M22_00495 [Actinomycetota bacterium]|nr:hypothetical protein [Actinomycetota bacterium]
MMITTTHLSSLTRSQIALRWLPTFVGFPLGGYIATQIVGPVDDVPAALIGGAVAGAILGAVQWFGLRRTRLRPLPWVLATATGFAVGLAAGAAVVDFRTNIRALAVQGAVCGALVGSAQAVALVRHSRRLAAAWPLFLAGLWALGWTVTTAAGIDVEAQYTVFGSSGALVVTACTSVLAMTLRTDE